MARRDQPRRDETRRGATGSAGRLRAVTSGLTAKAKQAAASLKAEFEAGKQGDDSPPAPIWGSPKEQFDAIVGLLRGAPPGPTAKPSTEELDADAGEVAQALSGVDWVGVRAATAERTGEATRAMRAMADHVDWAKVQPVAAQVSSALIAAVAAGQIGVGGRLGSIVARAITDQSGLAQRVATNLQSTGVHSGTSSLPPDFRGAIDVASRDA